MELDLIRKLAWSFNQTTGIEFEELFQEGCYIWCTEKYRKRYDCRKAAFNSFMYIRIRNRFATMAKKEKNRITTSPIDDEIDTHDTRPNPEQSTDFRNIIENLTDDARFVIGLIFESPYEFFNLTRPNKKMIERLIEEGLTKGRARQAINEIKEMLRDR